MTPRRLRICLYYPWLYLTSGGERTIIELARRSRHQITIVTNEYQPDATFPELRDLDVRVMHRVPVKRSLGAVALAASRIARQKVDADEFDALLIVCEGLGDLVALRNWRLPAFCLCLTPLRIAFDPVYRESYLAGCSPAKRLVIAAGARVFAAVDRLAWRRYLRVFPISREIAGRIERGRLATPQKMQLLHPGVDLGIYTPAPAREKVFFVPGRIMWTKNLELAIDAFREFQKRVGDPEWRLRIAGIVDRKSQPYLGRLRERAGDAPGIEFVIKPDDNELQRMYRDCFATLFTALNEDWGLVIIEAMASGKPVVALDRGGPREILRHEVDGLLAAPTPQQFADAMVRLVEQPDLYERCAASAPQRAATFGWPSFVNSLDDAIESTLYQRAMRVQPDLAAVKR
jgi:glycosyltransferase involved in cell wall biosynthesis